MLLSAELPTEEFTPEIPLEQQLWPEAIESPKIKLDIPENTATDFAPPQVSVISDEHISNELNIDLNIDRESFSQANHAFQRLSATYPSGIKVGFSNDLDIEDIPKRDIRDLGVILDTWNNANETYFYLDSRPHQYFYSPIKEQWDDLAVEQKAHLRTVLGVNFDTLAQDFFSGSGDVPDGIRTLQELIKNPDFQEKENLTNYLMQEGWLAKRNFFRSNPNEDENTYSRSRYSYEYTKFEINQLLCSAAVDLAEQGNSAQLGTILEHFAFSRVPSDSRFNLGDFPSPYEDATSVLLDENLSSDGRRVVLKEFVKVFGPISTVDTLSNKIHALSRTGNNKEESYIKDLINLYSLIEGENVLAPMEKLTNVYDVVDYAALDRPELTAKEATRLEAVARLFAEGAEYSTVDGHVVKFASTAPAKEQTEVVILDTGAGNARVSRELFIRGYKNCSALEYDPKNIRYALEKRPSEDFGILRGSWHNIPLATADYTNMNKAIDVCFTTERSFLHDRTAAEWFGLFDEFRRVSHYRAMLYMDLPDINSGVYKERDDAFRTNLRENLDITDKESHIIFDGPGKVKFNRMAISEEQLAIYCRLFGLVQINREVDPRPDEDMTDLYFTLAKDQNWLSGDISREELWNSMAKLGMFDFDVDYNMFVESWGMTIGQALLFGLDTTGSLHSSPYLEDLFKKRKGPAVWVDNKGGRLNLRSEWPSYE